MNRQSALTQLVALYATHGVTSTIQLVKLTGFTERAIWKAKAELRGAEQACTLNQRSAPPCTIVQPPLNQESAEQVSLPPLKKGLPRTPSKEITPPSVKTPLTPQGEVRCRARPPALEDSFEVFWKAFPAGRKKAKPDAFKAFRKAVAGRSPCGTRAATPAELIAAAKAFAATEPGEFVPMPSTWLNQGRWQDEPDEPLPSKPNGNGGGHWMEEKRQRDAKFMRLVNGGAA